jgi:FixJ family two-component response regulator
MGSPPVDGGHRRLVLVIDDEPDVASAIAALLEELDYACVIGLGGQLGIATFLARRTEIACVVLDLTMPSPGGREVMRVLREVRAELPIVLVSGYAAADVRAELARGPTRFVRKPFLGDELVRAIEAVLA